MRPVVFDGCFGWLHPAQGTHGIVLCGPLGQEANFVHRPWRELARRLAAAGFPTLRFDYLGTGNSTGDAQDPGRVEAWLQSVNSAIGFLRREAAIDRLTLVGFRFGATLAVACAERLGDVDGLVLLAPVTSGRAYRRELSVLARLNQRGASGTASDDLEAHGVPLAPETLAKLGEFEILQGGRRPVPRALILTRTGAADQLILAQRLKALGAEVQEGEFRDYSILRWHSDYTPYPTATFGQVLEWLSPGAYPPANDALNGGELPLPVSGVCDTAVVFGPSPGLFGVISQPLRPIASGASALIFLSAGSTTQVGNYRLWVSTARRLARAGYASLRFDIAGVGDSPAGTTSGAPHGSRKQGLANVKAALDWLEAQGFPRIILVAYCLSATLSREVVASDPRVVAQLLINPSQPFGVKPTGRTPARYISLACELRTWRRLLGGAIPPAKMLRGARDLARGVRMGIEKRILGRYARAHTTAASARTLAAQGVDTLLIVGEDDSCVERLEEYFATDRDRLAELLNVRICPLRGVGHDFPRRSDRDLLAGAILEYLQYAPHLQSEPRR